MSSRRLLAALATAAAVGCATPHAADAHRFAGKRFFPATLATDDPFVADELSLPTIQHRRTVDDGGTSSNDTATSIDIAKRITPQFGVGFGATWLNLRPQNAPHQSGFDNLAASVKYQLLVDEPRETIVSVGVDWDIGHSGATRVGAERFSTLTPAVFVGKGLGDLPESMKFWRPIALTGSLGVGFPTSSSTTTVDDGGNAVTEQHPHVLQAGFALEYSLPYLNAFVKDVGLPSWLHGAVPLVEVALSKPLDRGGGPTTGTVNPGILFAGRTMQFGIEAVVPINKRTGGGTGVLMQLHFFLDDLFPHGLGRPLIGGGP